MPKEYLRLSEHYVSVQGEGPETGVPTQFVRFAGCNMRCPLWPCDTQHAIQPEIWRFQSEKIEPVLLANRIKQQPGFNVCLTGGEPFMQNHDMLYDLVGQLDDYTVECFSNGSYIYPEWALEEISFIMDWKLAGSGEANTARDNRWINARALQEKDSIKFVVTDQADMDEARKLTEEFSVAGIEAQLWVGAAWGKIENTEVIDYVLHHNLPWRLNIQTHKYVWPADERGV